MNGNIVNTALTLATDLFNLTNIGNWQLAPASYNGVALMVPIGNADISMDSFGVNVDQIPFSGAYTALQEFTGDKVIPFGTHLGVSNVKDQISRRVVIHDIPGRDGNYFEQQGWSGETFTIQAVFWGIGYQVLYQQALINMLNDAVVNPANLNILVHPVRGTIQNCLLMSYSIDNSYARANCCVLNLTFKADNTPFTKAFPISPLTKLYEEIAAIAQGVENIAGAISLLSTLFTGSNTLGGQLGAVQQVPLVASANGSPATLNPLIRSRIDLLNTANERLSNILLYCSKLLYTYMKPPTFNDFYLSPVVINFAELPELFRFVTIFTANEVGILINYYTERVMETIALYNQYNLNLVFATKLDALRNSIVSLSQFAEILLVLQNTDTQLYVVPYDMSLRQVCFLNGISFLDADITPLLLINRDVIGSVNLIPKGTLLKLRTLNG